MLSSDVSDSEDSAEEELSESSRRERGKHKTTYEKVHVKPNHDLGDAEVFNAEVRPNIEDKEVAAREPKVDSQPSDSDMPVIVRPVEECSASVGPSGLSRKSGSIDHWLNGGRYTKMPKLLGIVSGSAEEGRSGEHESEFGGVATTAAGVAAQCAERDDFCGIGSGEGADSYAESGNDRT